MSVRRDEVAAALEARRELGPAYEDEIVDALVAKIEARLEERRPPREDATPPFVPLLASLGIAVPLLGIAGGTAGVAGVALVCAAIVLVNALYYLRPSGRRR